MIPSNEIAQEWFFAAQDVATFSEDPSTKVGAIVMYPLPLDGAFHWIEAGSSHNALVRGTDPSVWIGPRPIKYRHVVHAEVGALFQAGHRARGSTIAVSAHPCCECAKIIVEAGISCVVCPEKPWRDDEEVLISVYWAKKILTGAGLKVMYL